MRYAGTGLKSRAINSGASGHPESPQNQAPWQAHYILSKIDMKIYIKHLLQT